MPGRQCACRRQIPVTVPPRAETATEEPGSSRCRRGHRVPPILSSNEALHFPAPAPCSTEVSCYGKMSIDALRSGFRRHNDLANPSVSGAGQHLFDPASVLVQFQCSSQGHSGTLPPPAAHNRQSMRYAILRLVRRKQTAISFFTHEHPRGVYPIHPQLYAAEQPSVARVL